MPRTAKSRSLLRRRSRDGFTLVELLVVIAIIGVLVALLLPAIQAAREAARRSQCLSNLRQMSIGLLNYESSNGSFPSAFDFPEGANPATMNNMGPNWIVKLLPFIEQQPLYDQFDLTKYVSDLDNEGPRTTVLPSLMCGSDPFNQQMLEMPGVRGRPFIWARGNYAANAGNGPLLTGGNSGRIGIYGPDSPGWNDPQRKGVIGPNVGATLKEVTDGLTNSILVAEVRAGITPADRRGTWALGQAGSSVLYWYGSTGDANGPNNCDRNSDDVPGPKSADRPIMDRECMPDYTGDDWADQATTRSAHPGGVNLGMADGSAHFVSDSVDTDGSASTFHTNPDVQFKMSTWDRLIASSDGQVITESPF